MKKFTLMMVAGLFALAGSVQAQKKVVFNVNDVQIANGQTAELVINIDYDTEETVVGTNFDLYLPDGILLDGFDTMDEMMKTSDQGGKSSKRNLSKACTIDEECVWGEDGDNSFIYDLKAKADGKGILFILMDGDKLPFTTTHGKLITVKLKAIADVKGLGSIKNIAFTSKASEALDLNNIADVEFGVNQTTEGINDIQSVDSTAPAYNLQGVRVNGDAKGLIIRDGKKLIVK